MGGVSFDMDYRERITIEPGKRGGKPCIRGLRITVYEVRTPDLPYIIFFLSSSVNSSRTGSPRLRCPRIRETFAAVPS